MSIIAAYMVPHPPMIVPAVGRGSERQIEATRAAYTQVAEEIAALAPETIILSSPHATMYADYFHISPGRGAKPLRRRPVCRQGAGNPCRSCRRP